jgi:hypothetical protein
MKSWTRQTGSERKSEGAEGTSPFAPPAPSRALSAGRIAAGRCRWCSGPPSSGAPPSASAPPPPPPLSDAVVSLSESKSGAACTSSCFLRSATREVASLVRSQ